MLRLGRQRDTLRVVADQFGTPTVAGDLASAIVSVMRALETEAAGGGAPRGASGDRADAGDAQALCDAARARGGVLHAAGGGEPTTWFGFAEAIFALAAVAQPAVPMAVLEPIATATYPTPARRPQNSRLDCGLLVNRFGYKMPEWRGSLTRVMQEVLAAERTAGGAAAGSSVAGAAGRGETAERAR